MKSEEELKQLAMAGVTALIHKDAGALMSVLQEFPTMDHDTQRFICLLFSAVKFMEEVIGEIRNIDPKQVHKEIAYRIASGLH